MADLVKRFCAKCKQQIDPERVKATNSNLCVHCARELEQKLAAKNGRPMIHRISQGELDFNTIHVPRDWEQPKSKKNNIVLVPGLMPESQRVLDAQRRRKCLINVVYDYDD